MNRLKIFLYLLCIISYTELTAQNIYSLDECIKLALENNIQVKNAILDTRISEQTKKELFTNYFPQLSTTGFGFYASNHLLKKNIDLSPLGGILSNMGHDPTTLGIPPAFDAKFIKNGIIGSVTAIQPIFMGGQIINGNKLAQIGVDVNLLQVNLSEREVRLKTKEYYYQIISLKEKLKTIEDAEKQLNSIFNDVQKAVKAGIAVPNDLLRVDLEKQKVKANRLKVENGIRVSKLLLKYHTGITDIEFEINPLETNMDENPLDYYILPQEGISMRPENNLLDKSVEAAKLERKLSFGKNLPTVGVGAGWTYHNILDEDTDAGIIFAKISIPISDWWKGSHSIKRAKFNEQKAHNNREDSRNMMLIEIEAKWSTFIESYEQVQVARKSMESATENLRLNREYYTAGTSSLSDLLDAQTLVQQSRDYYVETFTNYHLKKSEYLEATGRK